jgi:hypothetical protein
MAMAEIRPPERQKTDAPLIPGFIKGAAIAGAMTWILALLAVLTTKSPSGSGLEALFPIFCGCRRDAVLADIRAARSNYLLVVPAFDPPDLHVTTLP